MENHSVSAKFAFPGVKTLKSNLIKSQKNNCGKNCNLFSSVAELEPPGAASFEAAPEPELIFW